MKTIFRGKKRNHSHQNRFVQQAISNHFRNDDDPLTGQIPKNREKSNEKTRRHNLSEHLNF